MIEVILRELDSLRIDAHRQERAIRRIIEGVRSLKKEMPGDKVLQEEVVQFLLARFETPGGVAARNEIESLRINGQPNLDPRPFMEDFVVIWESWSVYAAENGIAVGTRTSLGRELRKKFERSKSDGKTLYKGLRLRAMVGDA